MTGPINFNPFTGKALSTNEIQKLDINQDNNITMDELEKGLSWLTQASQDEESVLQIDGAKDGVKETNSAENTGVTSEQQAPLSDTNLGVNQNDNNKLDASVLDSYIDNEVEAFSNRPLPISQDGFESGYRLPNIDEVNNFKTLLSSAAINFVETYTGDVSDIEAAFHTDVVSMLNEQRTVMNELNALNKKESAGLFSELKESIDTAGNYISFSEKDEISDKGVDYLINQLNNNAENILSLKEVYPQYEQDEKFIKANQLLSDLKVSPNPKEDFAEVKKLLGDMLANIGVEKYADAVKSRDDKSVFNFNEIDKYALVSDIQGYLSNKKVTDTDNNIEKIQTRANNILESLRQPLLDKLRNDLGAECDVNEVNKLIDTAISDVISDFTDEGGFRFERHGFLNLHKRWAFNTKDLIDSFLNKLQSPSDTSQNEDAAKLPVSKGSILNNTELADSYRDNSVKQFSSKNEAILLAKQQLQTFVVELKAQLKDKLGKDYSSNKVDYCINQASESVLSAINMTGDNRSFLDVIKVNTAVCVDKFYDEFTKLYKAN